MALRKILNAVVNIWFAFVRFICSLFCRSRKHEDDTKPPILPLTANTPVMDQCVPKYACARAYAEDAASPTRHFVAAGMVPCHEHDSGNVIRDPYLSHSPKDNHLTSHPGSPNPLSKSTITSLHTSFAATKSNSPTPRPFDASEDPHSGSRRQADCGSSTPLDRSSEVQQIVLDLKHTTLVNFDHWVFRDCENVGTGLTEPREGTSCSGASGCEISLADNDSTEAIEPCSSTDKLKKINDSVSRNVIADFPGLSTFPISALSASSTCAFADIPPSVDHSAGAECVPLPTSNASHCPWVSGLPLSPEQQRKGRISLTPYPEGTSMTIDFGSPELANLKATLEAIKLLDDPPPGIEVDVQLSDDCSLTPEAYGSTIVVSLEEPPDIHHSSMAADSNGDKIPFEAPEPVLASPPAMPITEPDPICMVDHRPGKENDTTTTSDVPRDKSLKEDKARRKPLSTVAIGRTAEKVDVRDRDRYRGAAYSRVLPKPCLSASSSLTSVALANLPQFVTSPVFQNPATPPLPSGAFVPSTSPCSHLGQSERLKTRVVHDVTFGTPPSASFDSRDVDVRQDDGTLRSNGKTRRRKSILQCSTPNPNANNGISMAKGSLHEKSKSLSKSTGCQVKASTSSGLVK
ncbi:hypothetical protein AB1N83_006908 [Pleurotus pulmonarius]